MSLKALVLILPFMTASVDAAAAATCVKDSCHAQVRANRNAPSAFRASGCYSFLASTVTQAAVTKTRTVAAGFNVVTPGPACVTTAAALSQVPEYASSCANRAQYSSACSCFGIKKVTKTLKRCTTTVLVTPTSAGTTAAGTTTVTRVAAPTGCSNQGLAFAVYDNTQTDTQTGYFNFEPSDFTTPVYTGTIGNVQNMTVPNAQALVAIYGQYVHATDAFVLNHAGYMFAPVSGTYTFRASNVDDIFNFWIGESAYSGYTRENDNLDTYLFFNSVPAVGSAANGFPGTASYSVPLVGGLYYPIRYVFAQDTGAASFSFSVTGPDGAALFDSADSTSPYLVRFSCDGALAPAFPGFGSVTASSTSASSSATGVVSSATGIVSSATGIVSSATGIVSSATGIVSSVTSIVGSITSDVGSITSDVGSITSDVGSITSIVSSITALTTALPTLVL